MSEYGYIYIPHNCQKGGCNLHVSLHGCLGTGSIDSYIKDCDYLKYAASNDLIMLWPVDKNCWDVFGYTNEQYSVKTGV
jgi:poly(3-hydroxybutyrate) depolymerase